MLKSLQEPVVSALVVYLIGAACLALCVPFLGLGARPAMSRLGSVPWWAYIGGICNALFLMCTLLVTKKLGSATFTTIVVISAVVTSIALDHFGLMGFEVREASLLRLVGAGLAVVGVVLIAVF